MSGTWHTLVGALVLALATLLASPALAQPAAPAVGAEADALAEARIALALTEERVRVTARFSGARIVIYGVARDLQPGDDVVIVLRGPAKQLSVMQRQRTFGLWLNTAPVSVQGAPSFYVAAATRPLDDIAPPNALSLARVGLAFTPVRAMGARGAEQAALLADFRRAIERALIEDGRYIKDLGTVEILDAGLFRTAVFLPPGAPTGAYEANASVFRDGRLLYQRSTELTVARAGLERTVYDLAHNHPFWYGVFAVIFAVAAGWGAAAAFNRR